MGNPFNKKVLKKDRNPLKRPLNPYCRESLIEIPSLFFQYRLHENSAEKKYPLCLKGCFMYTFGTFFIVFLLVV